jgi:hypothetical protein
MSPEKKNPFEQLLKSHLSASLSQPPAEPCPDENWMAAYLEGSQSDHFKKTFEQHLLQCDRCQSEMAFLLKTHETEAKPVPSVLTAEPSPSNNLLSVLFGWTRAATLRPVFAILLVSVVTGVVGYRLLRDDRILSERSVETAESKTPKTVWPEAEKAPAPSSVNDQKSPEQKPSATPEPSMVRRQAVDDRLEAARESQAQSGDLRNKMKSNSQDREMKDGFAAEPPAAAPAEPNRNANDRLERRDTAVSTQALPEQLQKESLSASAVGRQNSQLETKADETTANTKTVQPAAPAGARSMRGTLPARKMEQDTPVNVEQASAADAAPKKKQVLAEGKGEAGAFAASEATAVSQIEVGGKRFDSRDGLWRDASILPGDPWPTVINMLSPDFEKYRKQLAPYQAVISRPEDVLIKLHNRVYRIQKAPK